MKENENNSTTYNNNHENNIALSIATLIINFHISFTLESPYRKLLYVVN